MLISDLKPLAILNNLIVINNDRLEGYDMAADKSEAAVLKSLFNQLAETSAICINALICEVYKIGGLPQLNTHTNGELSRAWEYVKVAVENRNHRALLNSCFYEEDLALKTYEQTLENEESDLTREQQRLILAQLEMLYQDHEKVKNLLNVLVKV